VCVQEKTSVLSTKLFYLKICTSVHTVPTVDARAGGGSLAGTRGSILWPPTSMGSRFQNNSRNDLYKEMKMCIEIKFNFFKNRHLTKIK
jgi:hypothetical protein